MDKLKYIPIALFSAYIIKLLIIGANIQDALISIGLMALVAYLEHKPAQKQIQQLNQEVINLKEELKLVDKRVDEARTSIVGMKMNSGIKSQSASRGF